MEPADEAAGYRHIDDQTALRTITDELNAVIAELDDSVVAESPEEDLARLAGVHEVKVRLLRRLGAARRRLDWLTAVGVLGAPLAEPRLLRPGAAGRVRSRHGLQIVPLVTAGQTPPCPISSGMVWLPPRTAASPHLHAGADVIVAVTAGHARTLWWDSDGRVRAIEHGPGEHLLIPRGVPHCGSNPTVETVVAHEFWSDSRFGDDVQLRPDLAVELSRRWSNEFEGASPRPVAVGASPC